MGQETTCERCTAKLVLEKWMTPIIVIGWLWAMRRASGTEKNVVMIIIIWLRANIWMSMGENGHWMHSALHGVCFHGFNSRLNEMLEANAVRVFNLKVEILMRKMAIVTGHGEFAIIKLGSITNRPLTHSTSFPAWANIRPHKFIIFSQIFARTSLRPPAQTFMIALMNSSILNNNRKHTLTILDGLKSIQHHKIMHRASGTHFSYRANRI